MIAPRVKSLLLSVAVLLPGATAMASPGTVGTKAPAEDPDWMHKGMPRGTARRR